MKNKKVYFENLDGLRFICFLMVFFYHSFYTEVASVSINPVYHFFSRSGITANGNLGVNIFFVLSGFLITYLLIQEKKLIGQIDLKKFWLRRILRIWPLFYFCVFFGFVCFPFFKSLFGEVPNEPASIGYYLTFLNNFDMIRVDPDATMLAVLWSVAVEEQFYFIWPIILFFLPVKRYWIAFSSVILTSIVFRALNDTTVLHEFHTLSCVGDMAVGAFGAWIVNERPNFKERIVRLKRYQIGLIYSIFIIIFFFRAELLYSTHFVRIFERPFIALVILAIILEQNYAENSLFKLSNFRTISKLGVMTYGLYCLHTICIYVVQTLTSKFGLNVKLWEVLVLEPSITFILSIIVSYISFTYYETPFLKLKEKMAYITRVSPVKVLN